MVRRNICNVYLKGLHGSRPRPEPCTSGGVVGIASIGHDNYHLDGRYWAILVTPSHTAYDYA